MDNKTKTNNLSSNISDYISDFISDFIKEELIRINATIQRLENQKLNCENINEFVELIKEIEWYRGFRSAFCRIEKELEKIELEKKKE